MKTIERLEFEEKNGRFPTWEEEREIDLKESMVIKKYANFHGYSDVDPYEVVRKVTDICVEIREMKTVQTAHPKDFHPGGFVGHYADNRSGQEYEYSSDETATVFRIRFSRAKRRWQDANGRRFVMADEPYKFYDYNF
jgi:hypothetical protein